ncbi:hypothetical protein CEXT_529061 [Caerostris extrusa]|uniref:Uncharacterized protein n=1 Tax=Caerostris extrusa TaxID=172846 RepID=A0AAV4PI58_CAEEX|nr:hypothetical protein CEXT_529061 [Caerostris extrusa]
MQTQDLPSPSRLIESSRPPILRGKWTHFKLHKYTLQVQQSQCELHKYTLQNFESLQEQDVLQESQTDSKLFWPIKISADRVCSSFFDWHCGIGGMDTSRFTKTFYKNFESLQQIQDVLQESQTDSDLLTSYTPQARIGT